MRSPSETKLQLLLLLIFKYVLSTVISNEFNVFGLPLPCTDYWYNDNRTAYLQSHIFSSTRHNFTYRSLQMLLCCAAVSRADHTPTVMHSLSTASLSVLYPTARYIFHVKWTVTDSGKGQIRQHASVHT